MIKFSFILRFLIFVCCIGLSNLSAQECGILYVTPGGGIGEGAGTSSKPANLNYALTRTNDTIRTIRLSVGRYSLDKPLELKSNIILEGGFLPQKNWIKTNADSTVLYRTSSNLETNPDRMTAVSGVRINNFRLQDLRIVNIEEQPIPITYYGLYLDECKNYSIVRCIIRTGSTSSEVNGKNGKDGSNGGNGSAGGMGCRFCDPLTPPFVVTGGKGGKAWSSGTLSGGDGGDGGSRGTGTNCIPIVECKDVCDPGKISAPNGKNGSDGFGNFPGKAGKGRPGLNYCSTGSGLNQNDIINFGNSCPTIDTAKYRGQDGLDGKRGKKGTDGKDGKPLYTNGFYYPENGTDGINGENGSGGGGGGGGSSIGGVPRLGVPGIIPDLNSAGGGGGGGGEGGEGGIAGKGGIGSQASFAIFTWNNGQNGVVKNCLLLPGKTGKGGSGGRGGIGGRGGKGGMGGNDVLVNSGKGSGCQGGAGGNGGNGGDGGDGGRGGDGSTGPSMEIFFQEDAFPVITIGKLNPIEYPIEVSYRGCTFSKVDIKTTAKGAVYQWFLNGNPATSVSQTTDCIYETTGFKSISLYIDGVPFLYSDFINIARDNPLPKISSAKSTICLGETIDFTNESKVRSKDTFLWKFDDAISKDPNTVNQTGITFNTVGKKWVTLTKSNCCGQSRPDSFLVQVVDKPEITLPDRDTICKTDGGVLLTTTNYPGAIYTWSFNDTIIEEMKPQYKAEKAGKYTLNVQLPGGCSNLDEFNLFITDSIEIDLGNDIFVCPNDPFPILSITNPFQCIWYLNGTPISSSKAIQTNKEGIYKIFVTSETGCFGSDEIEIKLSDVHVNLGPDKTICSLSGTDTIKPQIVSTFKIKSYEWYFDGNLIGSSEKLTADKTGTYVLSIEDEKGCSHSDTILMTVSNPIEIKIDAPKIAMVNDQINFLAQGIQNSDSLRWHISDKTFIKENITYIFKKPGTYTVFLIAYSGTCSDTAIHAIIIENNCANINIKSDFSYKPDTVDIAKSGTVIFENLSGTDANLFEWDFGDGSVKSNEKNPIYAYSNPDTYLVKLKSGNFNCFDSITKNIIVIKKVNASRDKLKDQILKIYPNPAGEYVMIECTGIQPNNEPVHLYDLRGRLILSEIIKPDMKKIRIDVRHISRGIYIINYNGLYGKICIQDN